MKALPIGATPNIQETGVPAGMRKCARSKCLATFVEQGRKKYCSRFCYHKAVEVRRITRYRKRHPEYSRRQAALQLQRRTGISKEEFEARIATQGNRCPIGNHEFSASRGRGLNNPVRDHCHATGKNRAIICGSHNRAALADSEAGTPRSEESDYDQKAVDVIKNLAMLVRRLAHNHPNEKLRGQAINYLLGEGLQGNPLREQSKGDPNAI